MASRTGAAVNVAVRLFARAREIAGVERLDIRDLRSPCDVRSLLDAISRAHGAALHAQISGSGVRVAINQELVDLTAHLADGDEVAFLPPVTGG